VVVGGSSSYSRVVACRAEAPDGSSSSNSSGGVTAEPRAEQQQQQQQQPAAAGQQPPPAAAAGSGSSAPLLAPGQGTAIVTGAISILFGVAYLVLVSILDMRGGELQPPPPEAFLQ
jgi:hypothetical protein